MKPNILFVDGPPAVGKDYFITNFAGEYARCYPLDGIFASLFNIYSVATSSDSKQVMQHFLP